MEFDDIIAEAKKEYQDAVGIVQFMRSEMIEKVAKTIEAAIYNLYGFKKGSVVNIDTAIGRNYAIQYFEITPSNILANNTAQDIIDRVRVVLRETNEQGELDIEKVKHTISCFIADIKLNSKINQ
jgi:hypothetical protein